MFMLCSYSQAILANNFQIGENCIIFDEALDREALHHKLTDLEQIEKEFAQ
jgi:hypothetical protein